MDKTSHVVGIIFLLLFLIRIRAMVENENWKSASPVTEECTMDEAEAQEVEKGTGQGTSIDKNAKVITENTLQVTEENNREGRENNEGAVRESEYEISEFQVIYQMPELPTGCEITALTMLLKYYGFEADKTEMASVYLPTLSSKGLHYGEDGRLYGNDMEHYFIGDPFSSEGIICGTGAIIAAADRFLEDQGSNMYAVDKSRIHIEELYWLVQNDVPVMVWITTGMCDRVVSEGWYVENGEYVDWGTMDHGAVLIGVGDDSVTIADPISGYSTYSKIQFEKVFNSRGNACVILQEQKAAQTGKR